MVSAGPGLGGPESNHNMKSLTTCTSFRLDNRFLRDLSNFATMDELIQEWGLDAGLHSKEAIIDALVAKLDTMLRDDPMGLIQLMYRLDIHEAQLHAALDSEASASLIAHLVWNRQEQKQILRATMQRPRPQADDELAW